MKPFDNIDDSTSIKRAFGDGLYDSYNNFNMFDQVGIELVTRIIRPTIDNTKSMMKSKIVSNKSKRRFKHDIRGRTAIEQNNCRYNKMGVMLKVLLDLKGFLKNMRIQKTKNLSSRNLCLSR